MAIAVTAPLEACVQVCPSVDIVVESDTILLTPTAFATGGNCAMVTVGSGSGLMGAPPTFPNHVTNVGTLPPVKKPPLGGLATSVSKREPVQNPKSRHFKPFGFSDHTALDLVFVGMYGPLA
jgi:hypothetical protein